MVAAKKLEMLVKEAPAALVSDLSCGIHSPLLHSEGESVGTHLNRLKQLLHNEGR